MSCQPWKLMNIHVCENQNDSLPEAKINGYGNKEWMKRF